MLYRPCHVKLLSKISPQCPQDLKKAYSTYHQNCRSEITGRTHSNDNCEVRTQNDDADSMEEMYQFQDNNPVQETKEKMLSGFKWNTTSNLLNQSNMAMHRQPAVS